MLKAELIAENEALKKRVAELEAALADVLAQLAAEKGAGKRQAAPFSRGTKKQHPQRPGRKKGHKAVHRGVPRQVDQVHEARLKQSCCLKCGGTLSPSHIQQQYQIDLPPVQPVVTQFNIEVAYCTGCGQRAQGRHPQQTSAALGPAAVQLGPRALALALEMKHALGLPYRKVAHILGQGFGLTVSASALARASQRLARQAQPTYDQLILSLRQQDVVCADETGWKINGNNAWLWVFTSAQITLYLIDPRRAGQVAERILGRDFPGVLSCDCLLAYNPLPYQQQKCLAHLLHRCTDMTEQPQPAPTVQLSYQVSWLLRAAIALKQQKNNLSPARYALDCARLEQALDRLLNHAGEPQNDAARRLVNLLRKQRQRLFTFLYHDPVPPTNNAAERAIRPAVIVRKTSAGNRSNPGAHAHALITSLWQTAQQHLDFGDLVARLLRNPKPEPLDLLARPEVEIAWHPST
jgi:transposase